MNDQEDENRDPMVDQVARALESQPLDLAELARAHGVDVNDRVFRLTVWRAKEVFRERTGIELVTRNGRVEATTPDEQLREAEKRFETAAIRVRRGYEIVSGAIGREPALVAKANRLIERQAARAAQSDAGALARIEEARRKVVLAGRGTKP